MQYFHKELNIEEKLVNDSWKKKVQNNLFETKQAFLHPEGIKEISQYILNNFNLKTHRASIGNRAKESLIVDFIDKTDLNKFEDKASIIEEFFRFAREEKEKEEEKLIEEEKLNTEIAKRYIARSLKREYASENGTELNEIMPRMSPLNPNYLPKKKSIFEKISAFVEKFKGIGKEE